MYGTEGADSAAWSVSFTSKVPGYNHFLFATGDCSKWLVATTDSVVLGYYSNADRPILASSDSSTPYSAKWYNRAFNQEDPWVSITDHIVSTGKMLYGEASNPGHASGVLDVNDGADVYIKQV